jgi:magnesium chelatase subunit H
VLLSHNVPPYGRAGLYRELVALRDLIAEYREDPVRNAPLQEAIRKKVSDTGLDADCPPLDDFDVWLVELSGYLQRLENRLFSSGLHVLGKPPTPKQLDGYLKAYFDGEPPPERVEEAQRITELLGRTGEEITNLLRGLNGEYVPPAPGGDLLRDGPGVLPTGRNIHALDPYRMPSPGAMARGRQIARAILERHRAENDGAWPETVAVMLWGLDAIKTRGESIGILLELVGAEPVKEGTGRIVRYDLRPPEQLDHPRIDVLVNLSGIFRDSFVNILELLDDLFVRAAAADEPEERNLIRRHARELESRGIENPTARLFSNPAGDFGSLVNDRVTDSNWEQGEELAATWRDRNAFSYGRRDRGEARPEVLDSLLGSTARVVQQIDSVEYGLTDIQEYYANTGALKRAAEDRRGEKVAASFVESFSNDTTPRELEELLRLEYRSKLLNPRWAEAMAAMGSGGAYEISQRMTALIGWAGTAGFRDGWVYDQAADTYALDAAMAERLRKANPEAFRNVVGRLLEAHSRGIWQATPEKLEQLRALHDLSDAELEGVAA